MSFKLLVLSFLYIVTGGTLIRGDFDKPKIILVLAGIVAIGMSYLFWSDVYDEGFDLLAKKVGERIEASENNTLGRGPNSSVGNQVPLKTDLPLQRDEKPSDDIIHEIIVCSLSRKLPAKTKRLSKTVIIQQASTDIVTIPPAYESVTETYVVVPSHREGAIFRSEVNDVVVQEAAIELVTIPATYETSLETANFEGSTVSKQYEKRYLKRPAQTVERLAPAITRTISTKVIERNGPLNSPVIPALTTQVERRVVKTPGWTQERVIPAVAKTLYADVPNGSPQTISEDGPCDFNTESEFIFELQSKLKALGFYTGKLDGKWSSSLSSSVMKFQIKNDLSPIGKPTLEVLDSLAINYRRL